MIDLRITWGSLVLLELSSGHRMQGEPDEPAGLRHIQAAPVPFGFNVDPSGLEPFEYEDD